MPMSPVTATSTGRVNLRDQTIVRFVMLTQRRCVWVVETPELACGRIVGSRRHDEFFEKGFTGNVVPACSTSLRKVNGAATAQSDTSHNSPEGVMTACTKSEHPMGCGDSSSRGFQHPDSFFPREDLRRDRERLSNFPIWRQKEMLTSWLKRAELKLSPTPSSDLHQSQLFPLLALTT